MYMYIGTMCVVLCLIHQSFSETLTVLLHTQTDLEGSPYTCKIGETGYCNFVGSGADNSVKSAAIATGTCAVLYENSPPGGESAVITVPNMGNLDFGNLNNKFSSMKHCQHTTRDLSCPRNTFVRKFNTFNQEYLSYFSADCFYPNSTTDVKATLKSHPNTPDTPTSLTCNPGALRGLLFQSELTYVGVYKFSMVINSLSGACKANGTAVCGEKQAICGFSTKTEEHSNLLRELKPKCCEVGDPSALCIPDDDFVPIMTCDCLDAKAPTKCTYSQTIGVEISTSMSQSMAAEFNFYTEMDASVGVDFEGLAANFGAKMGTSNTTSFDWTTAASNSWSKAVTNEVEMQVDPCMKTVLYQVVGTCSFYDVNVNQYKRVDTTCNGTKTEVVGSLPFVLGQEPRIPYTMGRKDNNEVRRRRKFP